MYKLQKTTSEIIQNYNKKQPTNATEIKQGYEKVDSEK